MRATIRLILNIVMAIGIPAVWISMALRWGEGNMLTAAGLSSLKYFTVLSNLLAGAAALVLAVFGIRARLRARNRSVFASPGYGGRVGFSGGRRPDIPYGVERLKYVAATAVGLTFLVVMGFLGPLYGYLAMFQGANLYLHLLFPVAAMLEVIFLAPYKPTRTDNLLAVLPTVFYAVYYVLNMVVNGIGEWPETNDWYGFMNWGVAVGAAITVVILGITWVIGLLLRKAARG